jgi:3-phenylpropionate/trans-cinnamate dioxygenase ferredoxin subunit
VTEPRTLRVCGLEEIPEGEVVVATDVELGRIAVFNVDGELFAIEDRCSHQEARLSDGYLDGCAVECPLHASLFDLRTGKPSGPPATTAVRVYAVRVDAGDVLVDLT